jgi:hypothetical protein
MQEKSTSVTTTAPNLVKKVSIRDVSGVLRKKAVDALAFNFATAVAEARQETDSESDADIAASLTASVTYDDVEHCFDTDGILLDARYDKEGRLDRVAVSRQCLDYNWKLFDVVDVLEAKRTLAAHEPEAKKRRIVTIEIGKGGRAMYEVFQ